MAAELADLMRNNKAVSIGTTTSANPYLVTFDSSSNAITASPNCFSAACSSGAQTAQGDIADWQARVRAELPDARVAVCFDATPFSSGQPQWACSNTGGVINIKIGWTRGSTNRAATGTDAFEVATASTSKPYVVLPVTAGNQ